MPDVRYARENFNHPSLESDPRSYIMTIGVRKIRGIQEAQATKLIAQKIKNSEQLLNAATTPKARAVLAASAGISDKEVLELANRADLARVKGIGKVFSDLLENAGVDTVKELAQRRPDNLLAKLTEVNGDKKFAKRAPTMAEVTNWVEQAKALPKTLKY
jgi:predicted flap endonuclease-1-like 5' DNA nuclease